MNKAKRRIKGQVVSDKMDKTVVVETHRYITDSKYSKRHRVTKKYFAHDPGNKLKIGDPVVIEESRPLSRKKRWIVISS